MRIEARIPNAGHVVMILEERDGALQREEPHVALIFDKVHPIIGEQLEKVVAGLPAVESLHDDEASAMGTVVTEILES